MLQYRVKTPPTVWPITVEQAKTHMKISGSDEDALILSYIKAATAYAESSTGMAFTMRTIELYRRSVPSSRYFETAPSPVSALVSVSYTDSTGSPNTMDVADLKFINIHMPSHIWLKYGKSWPVGGCDYVFEYTAGVTDLDLIPQEAVQAIYLMVGHFMENREDSVKRLPSAVDNLLNIIRIRQVR